MYPELRHFRTLVTIRDTGSLAAAARRLHLTQSALSHQVKELENRLQTTLYYRHGRRLVPTQAGLHLLEMADRILPLVDNGMRRLRQKTSGEAGRLHIVIECHSCFEWLMPTLDRYRDLCPDVEVDLTLAHSFKPIAALLHGEIDMVITSDPQSRPDLRFIPLFRFEALLIMTLTHPLRARKYIRPQDLQDQTLITYPVSTDRLDVFRHFLDPAGISPARIRHVELTAMILQLVASGRGVAALPNWAVHEARRNKKLLSRPLGADGSWAQLYCGLRRDEADCPYIRKFIELAKKVSRQTLKGIKSARQA